MTPDLTWLVDDPWTQEVRELLGAMDQGVEIVIVEGQRDRSALRKGGVTCTIRTCAQSGGLVAFSESIDTYPVAILTDYDPAGKQLNARLRDLLPDATVDPRWRRDLGALLTQQGHYDIESLNKVFDTTYWG